MIDTITFDLWNTLLSNKPQDNERYKQKRLEGLRGLLEENGFNVDFQSLYRAHEEGFEKCKETWEKNLDLDTQEQMRIMFSFLKDQRFRTIPQSLMLRLEDAFLTPILKDPPPLVEGAKRTVEYVRAGGYKIGLICNTGRTPGRIIREVLKKLDMTRYFGALTFSNELRIRKPDPQIFLHTVNQLKSDPANSLHVGDELRTDVLGARRAGMISVHFNPSQTLNAEIQSQDTVRQAPEPYGSGQAHRSERSRRTDFVPNFSIKELAELKTILKKIK